MKPLTRREFLRLLAAGAGAVAINQFLAACGKQSALPASSPTAFPPTQTTAAHTLQPVTTPATVEGAPSPTAGPAAESPAPTSTPAPGGSPDLVVARGSDPETIVRRAIAALGGMEKFVSPGASVIVKPNICVAYHSYEYAATTNPWVVGALVKLCYEAGAGSVQVLDYPFGGTAQQAYAASGIQEQVEAAGGEMAAMPGFKFVSVDFPQGQKMKKTKVFEDILKADVLINVPIAKHHSLAGLTMGMKNLMGIVQYREGMHAYLGQKLADLSSLVKPALTVLDAVRILTANGPTGGRLDDVKQLDTIVAGTDIVAVDSYGTTLFGLKPEDMNYIQAAAAMGLGRSDLQNLRIEEISV